MELARATGFEPATLGLTVQSMFLICHKTRSVSTVIFMLPKFFLIRLNWSVQCMCIAFVMLMTMLGALQMECLCIACCNALVMLVELQ